MQRDLENYKNNYLNQPFEKYQIRNRKNFIKDFVQSLNKHNLSILEIGCGHNSIALDVVNLQELVIVEPINDFLSKAKIDASNKGIDNCFFIRSMFEDCYKSLLNKKFDVVLISSLLHEVPNPNYFLTCLRKIIFSTDTLVHINVPNAFSFHRLLALEMGLIDNVFNKSKFNEKFQQNEIFDTKKLSNVIEAADFKISATGSYSIKPFTHNQLQSMLDQNIISEKLLYGLSLMHKYIPDLGSEIFANFSIND